MYAERCHHIENEGDLESAEKTVEFCAIIKMEYGSRGSIHKNRDMKEAKEHMRSLQEKLTPRHWP